MTKQQRGIAEHVLDSRSARAFQSAGERVAEHFDPAAGTPRVDPAGTPPALREFLARFAADSGDSGLALIRGITVGDLPPTPQDRSAGGLDRHPTTGNLLIVAALLGSPIGYTEENDGALVHDVHPVRGEEQRIENSGSTTFGFHTENVHHPVRPDFLGLLCLRHDHDRVGTARLASVREAVVDLPEPIVQVLRTPRFRSLYPTSFTHGSAGRRPSSEPHPVIVGQEHRQRLRFNVHNTLALDAEGTVALQHLSAALDRHCRQFLLEPGDMVVIDNHVAVHGRSSFTPRYDGRDRWLRRFYSLREVPPGARRAMRRPGVVAPMPVAAAS